MKDIPNLLQSIEKKTLVLCSLVKELKQEKLIISTKLQDQKTINEQNKNKIKELENNNSLLKISGGIQGFGNESSKAKRALNDLIQEIDNCILLLDLNNE